MYNKKHNNKKIVRNLIETSESDESLKLYDFDQIIENGLFKKTTFKNAENITQTENCSQEDDYQSKDSPDDTDQIKRLPKIEGFKGGSKKDSKKNRVSDEKQSLNQASDDKQNLNQEECITKRGCKREKQNDDKESTMINSFNKNSILDCIPFDNKIEREAIYCSKTEQFGIHKEEKSPKNKSLEEQFILLRKINMPSKSDFISCDELVHSDLKFLYDVIVNKLDRKHHSFSIAARIYGMVWQRLIKQEIDHKKMFFETNTQIKNNLKVKMGSKTINFPGHTTNEIFSIAHTANKEIALGRTNYRGNSTSELISLGDNTINVSSLGDTTNENTLIENTTSELTSHENNIIKEHQFIVENINNIRDPLLSLTLLPIHTLTGLIALSLKIADELVHLQIITNAVISHFEEKYFIKRLFICQIHDSKQHFRLEKGQISLIKVNFIKNRLSEHLDPFKITNEEVVLLNIIEFKINFIDLYSYVGLRLSSITITKSIFRNAMSILTDIHFTNILNNNHKNEDIFAAICYFAIELQKSRSNKQDKEFSTDKTDNISINTIQHVHKHTRQDVSNIEAPPETPKNNHIRQFNLTTKTALYEAIPGGKTYRGETRHFEAIEKDNNRCIPETTHLESADRIKNSKNENKNPGFNGKFESVLETPHFEDTFKMKKNKYRLDTTPPGSTKRIKTFKKEIRSFDLTEEDKINSRPETTQTQFFHKDSLDLNLGTKLKCDDMCHGERPPHNEKIGYKDTKIPTFNPIDTKNNEYIERFPSMSVDRSFCSTNKSLLSQMALLQEDDPFTQLLIDLKIVDKNHFSFLSSSDKKLVFEQAQKKFREDLNTLLVGFDYDQDKVYEIIMEILNFYKMVFS